MIKDSSSNEIYYNPKFAKLYKSMIHTLSTEYSTCDRLQVSAIIVKGNQIKGFGYNGVPKNSVHCNKLFKHDPIRGVYFYRELDKYRKDPNTPFELVTREKYMELHKKFSERYEVHAEINALIHASSCTDAILYCSLSPCISCAKAIYSYDLKAVYYKDLYDRSNDGIDFLREFGIQAMSFEEAEQALANKKH